MIIALLAATMALTEPSGPDGVVATAPSANVMLDATGVPDAGSPAASVQTIAPHGLTTDQQVARWVAERSAATEPFANEAAAKPEDDRQMHGQASFGIGTGGYRDYGVAVTLPLGDNAQLSLSYRQVENGYPVLGYPGYGQGYGYGHGYGYPAYGVRHYGPDFGGPLDRPGYTVTPSGSELKGLPDQAYPRREANDPSKSPGVPLD